MFGYNRTCKLGKLQIIFGLLSVTDGYPVPVKVCAGNTADPTTVRSLL